MGAGLSPHGRGNPGIDRLRIAASGSIPARAGEPIARKAGGFGNRVYPRTGGGTDKEDCKESGEEGLSPHGRGNPPDARQPIL